MSTGETKMVHLLSPRGVLVKVTEKTAAALGSTYKPHDAPEAPEASGAETAYEDMTSKQMQEALESRGLSKSGNKEALLQRLRESDLPEDESDEDESDEDESDEDESDNSDNA